MGAPDPSDVRGRDVVRAVSVGSRGLSCRFIDLWRAVIVSVAPPTVDT